MIDENNNVVDDKKYKISTKEDIEKETTYIFAVRGRSNSAHAKK